MHLHETKGDLCASHSCNSVIGEIAMAPKALLALLEPKGFADSIFSFSASNACWWWFVLCTEESLRPG